MNGTFIATLASSSRSEPRTEVDSDVESTVRKQADQERNDGKIGNISNMSISKKPED